MDVIKLCSELIKCKSVTPEDDGAIQLLSDFLSEIGFETKILTFGSKENKIKNLFAKYGNSNKKILGFLGHSDVVPSGNSWEYDPFSAVQKDGYLIGRGVADMKGGIAAFCSAAKSFIKTDFDGSIYIFITGDEEIGSFEGTQSLLKWCEKNNLLPNDCIIGEPTSKLDIGDRAYIGHRGSMNVVATSIGIQGHIAYLDSYKNSLKNICEYVVEMMNYPWKHYDKNYPKTNLEPTILTNNNHAVNVAPDKTSVNLNIRYGSDYSQNELQSIFTEKAEKFNLSLEFTVSGDAYCCKDIKLQRILADAIFENTNKNVEFSCGGGISDGRYMIKFANIIEFGLRDIFIHQKNERAKISDIHSLENIYLSFIKKYFKEF